MEEMASQWLTCLIIVAVAVGSRVGCRIRGNQFFASFTHVIINYYYSEQHGYDHDNLIEYLTLHPPFLLPPRLLVDKIHNNYSTLGPSNCFQGFLLRSCSKPIPKDHEIDTTRYNGSKDRWNQHCCRATVKSKCGEYHPY